jgi:transmembrane sensor
VPADSGRPADQVDWDALARFFAGESSAAEAEAASRWLAEHPEEAEAFASLDAVTGRIAEPPAAGEVDVDAAWMRMAAKLDEQPIPARAVERGVPETKVYAFAPRRSFWRSPTLQAAAAVTLFVGGATALWNLSTKPGVLVEQLPGKTHNTATGQRDSVVLADGSRVLLGPGSWLLIRDGYGDDRRDVHLEGEALFDVVHDDTRPFVVHAAGLMVHDLGTTFTVRTTNGTNGTMTVAVTQGAVRVARDVTSQTDSGVVLHAGDRGTMTPGAEFNVERGASLDDDLAFTRGQLVFRDTPLPAVASALKRWYGVNVDVIDSALNSRTLTASFQGEPIADVLRVIGLALDTPVSQQDSTVVIGRRGPPRT